MFSIVGWLQIPTPCLFGCQDKALKASWLSIKQLKYMQRIIVGDSMYAKKCTLEWGGIFAT